MRRNDKEIKDVKLIKSLLKKALVCRVALCDGNKPYIIPMNFAFKDNCLYLHSAREGKKIDVIKKNNSICFEVDAKTELLKSEKPCNWTMNYLSVVGSGDAQFLDEVEDKIRALNIIMAKYSDEGSSNQDVEKPNKTVFEYSRESIKKLAIIKVNITEITGKKSFH